MAAYHRFDCNVLDITKPQNDLSFQGRLRIALTDENNGRLKQASILSLKKIFCYETINMASFSLQQFQVEQFSVPTQ